MEIPTHFSPEQRTVIKRLQDIETWQNLRITPIVIEGHTIRDAIDLFDLVARADVDELVRLDAAMAAEQDRVAGERQLMADNDPHRALNDARVEEARKAYEFRHSPEGREERIIELLESIDAKFAGGGR
jgi:hypothetical protein